MIAITANAAIEITVAVAAHIVRCVIPHFVWDVLMNVPDVMNQFVRVALPNVRNAKRRSVRIV